MKLTEFESLRQMEREAADLLREHFQCSYEQSHAVMLTGGRTPLGIYRVLQKSPEPVDASLHLLISDERHVPLEASESNYGTIRTMVHALGVDESRVIRVHTELPLGEAADQYDEALSRYIKKGERITLGLLGLGADGHVASLFNKQDLRRRADRYAIAVPRPSGPDRVSVTRNLLLRVESLVFLVAGEENAEAVGNILNDPGSIIAGQALRGIAQTELWYSYKNSDTRG